MKKVILLCGKMRSGKNTAGNILQKYYESKGLHVSQMAFADQVKTDCKELFMNFRMVLENYVCGLKNSFNGKKIPKAVEDKINELLIWDDSWYEKKTAITRCLLQTYATDIVRDKFDENYWVKIGKDKIQNSESDIVIITDGRFPNEIEELYDPSYILYTVKIERNQDAKKNYHSSENSLDFYQEFNYIIDNNKDLESLTAKLIGVADGILENSKIFENKYEDTINLNTDGSDVLEKIKEFTLVTLQSKKKCKDFLVRTGIYNEDGTLTEHYK